MCCKNIFLQQKKMTSNNNVTDIPKEVVAAQTSFLTPEFLRSMAQQAGVVASTSSNTKVVVSHHGCTKHHRTEQLDNASQKPP
jgi:hypothetical protein